MLFSGGNGVFLIEKSLKFFEMVPFGGYTKEIVHKLKTSDIVFWQEALWA